MILLLYGKIVNDAIPLWVKRKEEKDWDKWEHYEDIREDMLGEGGTNLTPVPKKFRKKINPHKKHAV